MTTGAVVHVIDDDEALRDSIQLFLANVGTAPSVTNTMAEIMNTLLPPVVGSVGTHVTLELLGMANKGNPRFFHGDAGGRPGTFDKWRPGEWDTVEAQMGSKLRGEISRLEGMLQRFKDRMGRWPGE